MNIHFQGGGIMTSATMSNNKALQTQLLKILSGPILCLLFLMLPAPEGLSPVGMRAIAGTVWIVAWWMLDLFSLAGTGLLAIAVYTVLGVAAPLALFKNFGGSMIMIILGATLLIGAWTESHFIQRYAYWCMNRPIVGNSPTRFLIIFGLSCGLLSVVMPNIPLAVLFTAIAVATADGLDIQPGQSNLIRIMCMVAGMASCYGGIGSPLGGAPNLITIGYVDKFAHYQVEFWQWTMVGLPTAVICLFALFFLSKILFPVKGAEKGSLPVPKAYLEQKLKALGPVSTYEHIAVAVMLIALLFWIAGPSIAEASGIKALKGVFSVPGVAFLSGVVLFIIPRGIDKETGKLVFAMNWSQAQKNIGWSIMCMLLGGLVIGDALQTGGVDKWLSDALKVLLGNVSGDLVWFVIVLISALLSQLVNNLAVMAVFTPIVINLGYAFGFNPIAAALSIGMVSNIGVMFPFSSTPIAVSISGAKGHASMQDYAWLGLFICIVGAVIVFGCCYLLGPIAFSDVPPHPAP